LLKINKAYGLNELARWSATHTPFVRIKLI